MAFNETWGYRNKGIFWLIRAWIVYTFLLALACVVSLPLEQLFRYGLHAGIRSYLLNYFSAVWNSQGEVVLKYYFMILPKNIFQHADYFHIIPFIPFLSAPFSKMIIDDLQPHDLTPRVKGIGREATLEDLKKWKLLDGFIIVLGKLKGKWIKLNETLSVMAFAPPGTGKTAAIVVPTITECDGVCMIVHDPKPEVAELTSGYRALKGITFTLNWAAEDDAEKGIYHPSWNALSPDAVPPLGPSRDLYVDSMVKILIEDPRGSADPHWVNAGRAALSGMLHYIISKTERARANDYFFARLQDRSFDSEDARLLDGYYERMKDPLAQGAQEILRQGGLTAENYVPVGTWQDIPKNWIGHEACIPMMIDWLTEAQNAVAREADERKRQGDQMAAMADGMKEVFMRAVKESERLGYAKKAVTSFTDLGNKPDRERGSILSTAMTSLDIFTNSAVRARTSHSDIHFKYLRGMIDPRDGKWKPVAVYISVDQVNAIALAPITGIFMELMSVFLISNKPDSTFRGEKLGPYPTLFVVDEFPVLPKMDSVMRGPDIGRGQQVSYLLIAQDVNQLRLKYSKEQSDALFSTTAAKIVLRQNSKEAADSFVNLMGRKTSLDTKVKNHDSVFKMEAPQEIGDAAIFSAVAIMGLDLGKQLVLYQGAPNFPIKADSPLYFKDEELKKKVYAKGMTGPAPAAPLPEFLVEHHKRRQIIDAGGG